MHEEIKEIENIPNRRFRCGGCGSVLAIAPEHQGIVAPCPCCGGWLVAPTIAASVSPLDVPLTELTAAHSTPEEMSRIGPRHELKGFRTVAELPDHQRTTYQRTSRRSKERRRFRLVRWQGLVCVFLGLLTLGFMVYYRSTGWNLGWQLSPSNPVARMFDSENNPAHSKLLLKTR